MALFPLMPQYTAGPSVPMLRRAQSQNARRALAVSTAGGGGLAGARQASEQMLQTGAESAYQAAQMRQQQAMVQEQERAGLARGLLSGAGAALGAVGDSRTGGFQQALGVAGAVAPLLLASDRRLKRDLRGATSEDIEAVRQFIMARRQRQQPERIQAPGGVMMANPAARPRPPQRTVRVPGVAAAMNPGDERFFDEDQLENLEAEDRRGMPAGGALAGGAIPSALLRSQRNAGLAARPSEDLATARRLQRGVQPRSFRGPNGPVGVVAQDVERTAPAMVRRIGPQGVRAIDIPQATGALMAGQSDLHRRLQQLEARRRSPHR